LYALKKGVGTFSFSEIDVVDLFMSYGINGIAIFTTIMLKIYNKKSPYDNKVFFWYKTLLVLLFILTGTLTGHIFFFGFTSFIFALYSGLLSSKNNLEPSYRFVGK